MAHFQIPTTHLPTSRVLELREFLEQVVLPQERLRIIIQDIHKTLIRDSPQYPELQQCLQSFLTKPNQSDLLAFAETGLIPDQIATTSELRKKRRQTPRRRYTLKKYR